MWQVRLWHSGDRDLLIDVIMLSPSALSIFILALVSAGINAAEAKEHVLLVAHQSRGLLSVGFNPSKSPSQSLRLLNTTPAGTRPGWICTNSENVYSVARTFYPTNASDSGGVYSWLNERGESELQPLSDVSSQGRGGVHCDVSKDGRLVIAANIDGSTVSVFPVAEDGAIQEASHVFQHRLASPGPGAGTSQIQSNPHQAEFDPSNEYFFVPDKGGDVIYVYQVSDSGQVSQVLNVTVPLGTGPRHLKFTVVGPTRSLLYVVNELANTLAVFAVDGVNNTKRRKESTLEVTLIQTVSTLEPGSDPTPPSNIRTAAEVAITSDRRFVYVSNRWAASPENDTFAIYSLNEAHETTPLRYLGTRSTEGKVPRHFSISNDSKNKYVAVTNQLSNNLVIIERNTNSGSLGKVVGSLALGDYDQTGLLGPQAVIWR
ncbi:6-phosphogluconolactonase [Paramyrothecium foliicola]|nr:6-phosphogluconolactonase [Paramyrothecium foliicola]